MQNLSETINIFLPELVLLISVVVNFVLALIPKDISYKIFKWFSVTSLTVATGCLFLTQTSVDYHYFLDGAFVTNIYTAFVKFLILLSFFLIMLFSRHSIQYQKDNAPHYCNALIIATLGAMFLVSSNNFISVFISLLITTLGGILIAKYSQNEKITVKYILISLLSIIVYIIGTSMLYAQFHEINFEKFAELTEGYIFNFSFICASVFTISSLCFQIFAFPFVSWKNHICKSLSYPALTFLSVVPMIAGFSVLSRMLVFIFSACEIVKIMVAVMAIVSIFLGLILGLQKENLKEIITSNTTIQSGIMLLGLSCFSVYSLSGVLFYLFCYSITMVALGASLTIINKSNLSAYQGLIYTRPYYAFATTLCFLTLAGLAPTCGFISKIYLFSGIARSDFVYIWFMVAAMILMLGVVMFYFRLASISFLSKKNVVENFNNDKLAKIILYTCTILIFFVTVFPAKAIEICQIIAYYI